MVILCSEKDSSMVKYLYLKKWRQVEHSNERKKRSVNRTLQ